MMKMHGWLTRLTISIVLISALAGCRTTTASNSAKTSPSENAAATSDSSTAIENSGENLDENALNPQPPRSPLTSPLTTATANSPLSVPNLIPPTTSSARSPQSEIGRTDPFAAIVVSPTVSVRASTPPPVAPASAASTPIAAPVAAAPLPLPALQPAPVDINQFPPVLPVPARRLSEAIEISGVVEVGGKTSVIVQVPNEQTSRYVHVGEYVSNGNVLVKRVEMGIEPVVILEENGTEVTRYVGSGSPSMGLL